MKSFTTAGSAYAAHCFSRLAAFVMANGHGTFTGKVSSNVKAGGDAAGNPHIRVRTDASLGLLALAAPALVQARYLKRWSGV
ncbi:hypothetical protein [Leisingera sp. ANG-M7]|uniref:hypothetical protein n=1 Tax=Leisingera sp. ANG-M7 TaxID=1577902 RepID=UPI000690EF41|nr:hypothetical protein [Leisingera sp. ANG-M7]